MKTSNLHNIIILVWYWWQGLWKLYGIKDFNIIKSFLKEKKSLYRDIYCYRDITFVISWYKILVISPTPSSSYRFIAQPYLKVFLLPRPRCEAPPHCSTLAVLNSSPRATLHISYVWGHCFRSLVRVLVAAAAILRLAMLTSLIQWQRHTFWKTRPLT